jgi:hypothetical protein
MEMRKTGLDPLSGLRAVTLLEVQRSHQANPGRRSALRSVGEQLICLMFEP